MERKRKRSTEAEAMPEQQAVIAAEMGGCNVRILAVPGAGKTFTLERVAAKLRLIKKRVLCLTDRRTLQIEWREKNPMYGEDIPRFHSLACKPYPTESIHDETRLNSLLDNPPTRTSLLHLLELGENNAPLLVQSL